MKPGGGKAKGNSFELATCKDFSRWLTNGQRADCFARNVISGGSFTKAQRNSQISGMPGDIMANHPLAFDFLKFFSVECKHKANIAFEGFLFDWSRESFLWKTFLQARGQAEQMNAWAFVVAKQNRRPTIMLMDWFICERAASSVKRGMRLRYHQLHRGQLGMLEFDNFLQAVDPGIFLAQMGAYAQSKGAKT